MSLDDFKTPWRAMQESLDSSRIDEIAKRIQSRMSRFDRAIRRRDMLENAAAVFVILFFSYIIAGSNDWATSIGATILVIAAVVIMVVLNVARLYKATPSAVTLAEHCQLEIRKVDRQIFLLRNIIWWYAGPLMLGCCVMSLSEKPLVVSLVSCGLFVIFGLFIYRINQKAVTKQLLPLRQDLMRAHESFNEHSDNNFSGENR